MHFLISSCLVFASLVSLYGTEPQFMVIIQGQNEPRVYGSVGMIKRLPVGRHWLAAPQWKLDVGEVYPVLQGLTSEELRGAYPDSSNLDLVALQLDEEVIVVPKVCVRMVEQRDLASAAVTYGRLVAERRAFHEKQKQASRELSERVAKYEREKQLKAQPAPSPSSVPPVSIPSVITVEPTFYWNVEVVVGRKYAWTEDMYERYKTITTEVQAKSKSEAESIAASRSYTTNSNLFQSKITVEPAGTKNAKFRVYKCTATRQ